jgi:serine/threonine-protein kinase
LKPANVKIAREGAVKVLDLGLAKATEPSVAPGDLTAEPTRTATKAGAILGTPAYMPPEQATGAPVDRRADIWAFGVVLFEMLSGWRLYPQPSVTETLAGGPSGGPRVLQLALRCDFRLRRRPQVEWR